MESTLLVKNSNNNCYLYDYQLCNFLCIHPIFYELIKSNIQKTDSYYYRKYNFLKEHGWFTKKKSINNVSRLLTESDIETQIANTEQLTFEVTTGCNLNCYYCGFGELYNRNKRPLLKHLKFEKAKTIIDFCFSLWYSNKNKSRKRPIYIGFYGGEPLLNFKLIEQIVLYVKQKDINNRICFTMTSNALLLNKYVDFLVENKFHLLLSLDGDKSNNAYRLRKNGSSSFKEVCKNIDSLYQRYPEYFKKHVNFNAVLHDKNAVEEIYDFFYHRYGIIPRLSELNTYGIVKEKRIHFKNIFNNYEDSLHKSTKKNQLIEHLSTNIPFFRNLSLFVFQYQNIVKDVNILIRNRHFSHLPTGTCSPFSKKIFVSTDGLLYPCETIHRDYPLGEIINDKIQISYSQIVSFYNEMFELLRMQCNSCYYAKICVQCLFNMPMKKGHRYCNSKMNKIEFTSFLSKMTEILECDYYIKIIDNIYWE